MKLNDLFYTTDKGHIEYKCDTEVSRASLTMTVLDHHGDEILAERMLDVWRFFNVCHGWLCLFGYSGILKVTTRDEEITNEFQYYIKDSKAVFQECGKSVLFTTDINSRTTDINEDFLTVQKYLKGIPFQSSYITRNKLPYIRDCNRQLRSTIEQTLREIAKELPLPYLKPFSICVSNEDKPGIYGVYYETFTEVHILPEGVPRVQEVLYHELGHYLEHQIGILFSQDFRWSLLHYVQSLLAQANTTSSIYSLIVQMKADNPNAPKRLSRKFWYLVNYS